MILPKSSLQKLYRETQGFAKVFKNKIVRDFCEECKNEGFKHPELLEKLLLVECSYYSNKVNFYEFYNTLGPLIDNMNSDKVAFALTLCEENWQLSSLDLIKTINQIF